ncbi:peptidylprolyl isomerase [Bermanella marisrubri]|uniref:Peptidyl-prolyl cis-trans isomerase n=1 Tax=Bermanella marisrubri TaxID=207949 RepID=Q1N5L2_9GAMM|nr:peptidylprolyl isomerase [Bermanella marisrubri]EAT13930.1 peptidyl-prolyl cis-trans isomerase A [Oceanobacter sp. RED65] [Bermanella marisrubri]
MRLILAFLLSMFSFAVMAESQSEPSAEQADVATPYVTMKTNMGDIILELNPAKAPISVANFLEYAQNGYYDGTLFHRVIPDFMIQAGGFFTPSMIRKATNEPIKNEADNGLFNNRGTIAMARTAAVDSATSQFFINVKNNHFLNHGFRDFGYAVFGKVISGIEVVDAISTVETTRKSGHQNVPVEPVAIESVTVSYDKPVATN